MTEAATDKHRDDKVYVPTKAVETVIKTLEITNLAMIIGMPGSGKSTIAIDISSKLNVPTFLLNYPNMELRLIDCSKTQLVIIDDIFGKENPQFIENNHSKILELVNICIHKNRTKVIITSRPFLEDAINDVMNRFFRRFPSEIVIDLDGKDKLLGKEKISMLEKYIDFCNITLFKQTELLSSSPNQYHPSIFCERPDVTAFEINLLFYVISKTDSVGFPAACRELCLNKDFAESGQQFFKNPSRAIMVEITAMRKRGKQDDSSALQYCILVYVVLNGKFDMNKYDSHRLNQILEVVYPGKSTLWLEQDITDAINDLTAYYIMRQHDVYVYQHNATLEAVAFSFGSLSSDSQRLFVKACSWTTLMTFLRPFSYNADQGENIIKLKSESYSLLLDRFRNDWYGTQVEIISKALLPGIPNSSHREIIQFLLQKNPIDFDKHSNLLDLFRRYFSVNLTTELRDILNTVITSTSFSSVEKFGNSFVHYWMIENFENKESLFKTIITEFPELMQVINRLGHTAVHLALYTGWYSIITEHYSSWIDEFYRIFDCQYNLETFYRFIRMLSVSNTFNLVRIIKYSDCLSNTDNNKENFLKKRSLLAQNGLECFWLFKNGTKIIRNEIFMNTPEWKELPFEINSKIVLLDTRRSEHLNLMEKVCYCNAQKFDIFSKLLNVLGSSDSLVEEMIYQYDLNNVLYGTSILKSTEEKIRCGSFMSDSEYWKEKFFMTSSTDFWK